eukprot:1455765-Amphidinium_carterae.1
MLHMLIHSTCRVRIHFHASLVSNAWNAAVHQLRKLWQCLAKLTLHTVDVWLDVSARLVMNFMQRSRSALRGSVEVDAFVSPWSFPWVNLSAPADAAFLDVVEKLAPKSNASSVVAAAADVSAFFNMVAGLATEEVEPKHTLSDSSHE